MLKWLFGKREPRVRPEYTVWLNAHAKVQAVLRSVRAAGPGAVVVVLHLDESVEEFESYLAVEGFEPKLLASPMDPSAISSLPDGVYLVRSDLLVAAGEAAICALTRPLHVIAAEPHFAPEPDLALMRFVGGFEGEVTFRHHVSLDDPLMALFAGEGMKQLLIKLGMTEDEPIDHKVVSNSIVRAQAKLLERMDLLGVTQYPTSLTGWNDLIAE